MQQIQSEKCHRALTRGYVLAAIFASIALHLAAAVWWISRPQQNIELTGLPTVTVDLIAQAPAPPSPVPPMPQSSPPPEPEPLREEEMAEQVKIIKKKPPEKKQSVDKKPEKISRETAPVAPAAVQTSGPTTPLPTPIVAARYDADYLNNPPPDYPPLSRRLGEEGRVILRVQLSADGKPLRVELKSSSGSERLDNAARKAAEKWRFVPAKQDGIAVASWVEVPLQFSLKK